MQPRPDDVASEASYLTESCLPTGLLNDSRPASRLESPRMRVMVPCQIIVKNLPDDVTAEQISTFFAPCGETVAVMLMRHGIVPLRGCRRRSNLGATLALSSTFHHSLSSAPLVAVS